MRQQALAAGHRRMRNGTQAAAAAVNNVKIALGIGVAEKWPASCCCQTAKDSRAIEDRAHAVVGAGPEMLAHEGRCIETGQQRCLARRTLRPARNPHLCVQRDKMCAGAGCATGAQHGRCPTKQAGKRRVSARIVLRGQGVEGRVIFAYANTVQEEKDHAPAGGS